MTITTIATLCFTVFAASDDWPHWRGLNHDGVSQETDWTDRGELAWIRDIGLGHSCPSIRDGRIYVHGFDVAQDVDRITCLNAVTGEEFWNASYAATLRDQNHSGGTLTTPTLHEDSVFLYSREGVLRRFDAQSGTQRWSVDVTEAAEVSPGLYGFAGSPLIHGDFAIVCANRVVAISLVDGSVAWMTDPLEAQYSTPTPFTLGDESLVAVFTEADLRVLDPSDGQTRYTFPWRPQRRGVNASSPIVVGERLFISSAYQRGCALIAFEGEEATSVWLNKRMRNKMAGGVLANDHIFGFDESVLKCLDLEGAEKWRTRGLGNGAIIAAGDRLILTTSKGESIVARANGDKYEELSRIKVFDTGTLWAPPVLVGGRIYVRSSDGGLACLDHRSSRATTADTSTPKAEESSKLPEASSLFERHLQEIGGEQALRSLDSLRLKGTFAMRAVGFKPVRFVLHRAAPNRHHAEIGLPSPIPGNFYRVFDGDVAWEVNHYRGDKLETENAQRELRDSANVFDAALFKDSYTSMRTHGIVEFADQACYRVDTKTASGAERRVYFSTKSGLLIGREGPTESLVIFDNYQPFSGLLIPRIERRFQSDTGIEEIWNIETIEQVPLDSKLFERPTSIQELLEDSGP